MESKDPSSGRKILITGCNRGIGLGLATKLCSPAYSCVVILTARTSQKALTTSKKILKKYPNAKNRLFQHELEVNDQTSRQKLAKWIETKFKTFDVLINNAAVGEYNDVFGGGYYGKGIPKKVLEATINTNVINLIGLTNILLPYLSEDGKILNVASENGQLSFGGHSQRIRKMLTNPKITEKDILTFTNEFMINARTGKHNKLGWGDSAYNTSKAIVISYTMFALTKKIGGKQQAYSLCPGWVRTDMGTNSAPLSLQEGLTNLLFLIQLPFLVKQKYQGMFFRFKQVCKF